LSAHSAVGEEDRRSFSPRKKGENKPDPCPVLSELWHFHLGLSLLFLHLTYWHVFIGKERKYQ